MSDRQILIADRWLGMLGAALITCAAAFAAFGMPPLPKAPLLLLGVPSPLTGMTRSFVAMASGDVGRAFDLHPLGPLCFLASAVAAASFLATTITRRRPALVDRAVRMRHAGAVVAGAFVLVWIRQIIVFT